MGNWETRDVAFLALGIGIVALLLPAVAFVHSRPRIRLDVGTQSRDDDGTVVIMHVTNAGARDALLTGWSLTTPSLRHRPKDYHWIEADLRIEDARLPDFASGPPVLYLGSKEVTSSFTGEKVLRSIGRFPIPGRSDRSWAYRVAPVSATPATYEGDTPPLMDESEWFGLMGYVTYRPLGSLFPERTVRDFLLVAVVHRPPD